MNAANQAAFIGAMQSICAEPTLGTVQSWLWSLPNGCDSYFLSGVCMLDLGLDRRTPLSVAKARLKGKEEQQTRRQASGHWSFDMNRLIAIKQALATIEAFETRNRRAA